MSSNQPDCQLQQAALELRRAVAVEPIVSIGLFDIAGLGAVNRRLGWQAGDLLVKEFELRLDASTRTGETAWRLGGDEYLVLMVGVPARRAKARVRYLQRRVCAEYATPGGESRLLVWLRAGGATVRGGKGTAQDLLIAADCELRRSKRFRECVSWTRL